MTKRIRAKHKVDRRLKVNLWGKPKSPFNTRNYPPGQHGQSKKENLPITVSSYMPNKNLNHTTVILMKDNLEMFIGLLLKRRVIRLRTW